MDDILYAAAMDPSKHKVLMQIEDLDERKSQLLCRVIGLEVVEETGLFKITVEGWWHPPDEAPDVG